MKMEAQPVSIASSSGAHIRSRITVVCAECKRLKLKCDRRTPCSSCIKRDTVPRCLYSAAAAEKIDVQSLHNRVLTLESQIAQLASQSFVQGAKSGNPHLRSFLNDRNVVAAGQKGSSIIISLDDVAGIWLDALDISDMDERVVLTPQPPTLPAGATSPHVFTDLDLSKFRIPPSLSEPAGTLGVTPALVQLLPQNLSQREEMLKQLETTLELHPCINFPHFKGRILELYRYAAAVAAKPPPSGLTNGIPTGRNSHSRARSASASVAAAEAEDMESCRPSTSTGTPLLRPSLSFFSATAAAFALAARILGSTSNANTSQGTAGTGPGPGRDYSSPGLTPHINLGAPQTSSQPQQQPGLVNSINGTKLQMNMGSAHPSGGTHNFPSTPVNSPGTSSSVPSPPGVPNGSGSAGPSASGPGRATGTHGHSHASPSTTQSQSRTSPTPVSPTQNAQSVSPSALFTLSLHSLTMHELSGPYDLDYLVALLLQVLFLLYDNGGLKNPSLPQILFPMVGKMVNVARMMGLWVDPSEVGNVPPAQGSRYGLFESEMRRRIWWDIYFYDLFVSDAMGQPPLIQDDFATCNFPTDLNEDSFSPASMSVPPPADGSKNFTYFSLKCRLAQLVKGMKKRTFRDPFRPPPPPASLDPHGSDLSIDAAIAFESEIAAWIAEIPPTFRLNMLEEDVNQLVKSLSPVLIAQQCEIMTITSRLVIKIFVPFLKRNKYIAGPSGFGNQVVVVKTPHHAVHACVNAAHTIIHASKVAHTLYKHRLPAIRAESLFYSFGRQLFDAAVISAHSVITSPQSLFAKVAMEDLKVAVEIMRDPVTGTPGPSPFRVNTEGAPPHCEALKIVELLQSKAEAARAGIGVPVLGVKRKHSDLEEALRPGFILPYVGGRVSTSFTAIGDDGTVISEGTDTGAGRAKFERRENHVGRDRSQRANYPSIGVRVRTSSTKSTDSTRAHANEALSQVKSKTKVKQQPPSSSIQSPVAPIPQGSMPPPGPPSTSEPRPYTPPPPTAPAIASQPIQQQQQQQPQDFSQMVSPDATYRPDDEAMMHYTNSQQATDYMSNPPPTTQAMYDYATNNTSQIHSGAGPPGSGSFYVSPTSAYPTANPTYAQPTMMNQAHLGMPPPPMLGLATTHAQSQNPPPQVSHSSPTVVHAQQDNRYHPAPDTNPETGVESMPQMQYEMATPVVPGSQGGWMDNNGHYAAPQNTNPGWGGNYGYWKGGTG